MPDEVMLTGRVERGKLKVRGWRPLLALPDGEVTITVERKRATRSLIQNAYYFGVVLRLLSEHTGYTVDELHDYCKQRFNPKRIAVCDAHGEIKDEQTIGRSTTKLNRVTFGEDVDAIREWAATDLDVVIPDPDPQWRQVA